MIRRTKTPNHARTPRRPYRFARAVAAVGLLGIAVLGAVNSWGAMYQAAAVHLAGVHLPTVYGVEVAAATVPLLLDALIVAASLRYVVGVKEQRPVAGWRVAAHSAIAATVAMNAATARTLADVPWHVVAPAVLSLVVELTARDILGQLREVRRVDADRIPLRLWLSAPAESVRTSWRMARTGERSAAAARASSDACAAARDALRHTLPGTRQARVRRQVTRRLWAGTVLPEDVFAACGWSSTGQRVTTPDPETVLRAALRRVIDPAALSVPAKPPTPAPTRPARIPEGARNGQPPVRSKTARPVTSQVKRDVPDGLTPSAVTVWSYLLGKGPVRRARIIDDLKMSESTVKTALLLLADRGHVEPRGGGIYESVDPLDDPAPAPALTGQGEVAAGADVPAEVTV